MVTFVAKVELMHTYEATEELELIVEALDEKEAKIKAKKRLKEEEFGDPYGYMHGELDYQDTNIEGVNIIPFKKENPERCKKTIDMFLG